MMATARPVATLLLALFVALFVSSVAPAPAEAQPGGDHAGHDHAAGEHGGDGDEAHRVHEDGPEAHGRLTALFFWLFAAGAIAGSLFVITRRNLVAAVIGMIFTFFALAGLFLMLYAGFLAALQVLVYAGAIMVLFVFVIMILNKEEDEPWAVEGLLGKGLAGVGLLYLLYRIGGVLWKIKDAREVVPAPEGQVVLLAKSGLKDCVEVLIGPQGQEICKRVHDFGSVKGVGYTLFTDYIFPFEAVSIVLLVAVVGAIAVARPRHPEEEEPVSAEGEAS